MATSPVGLNTVFEHLRRAVLLHDGGGLSDGQLLEFFIQQNDGQAFEALLRRHAPMVMRVCRRILGNHHDAEEAFQVVFLVLARKAASVKPREMVANWLHGVAHRSALKAKGLRAKIQARERHLPELPDNPVKNSRHQPDLQDVIDLELSRLGDNYRLPILLCDLEGKTIKKVAQELGWPQGTVAGRLARGRKMLAKRLARHGLAMAGGLALLQNSASASVPIALIHATVKAAGAVAIGKTAAAGLISANVAFLMKGMVLNMMLPKLKPIVTVLLVAATAGVGGSVIYRSTTVAAQNGTEKGYLVAGGKDGTAFDPEEKARLESKLKKLTEEINKAFPDSRVNLSLVGDKVVVDGQAKDVADAAQILRIARSNAPRKEASKLEVNPNLPGAQNPVMGNRMKDLYDIAGPNVINRLRIPGQQADNDKIKELPPARIGQIIMVGEQMDGLAATLLRKELGFFPGQILDYFVLGKKGKELSELDEKYKITITVLDENNGREYKDLLVQVEKKEEHAGKSAITDGLNPPVPAHFSSPAKTNQSPPKPLVIPKAKTEMDRMQGIWSIVSIEQDGKKPAKLDNQMVFMVDGTRKRACFQGVDFHLEGGLYLDPTGEPKTFDLVTSGWTREGIYSLDGDTLKLCYQIGEWWMGNNKRPTSFETTKGSNGVIVILKRIEEREVFPYQLADGSVTFPKYIEPVIRGTALPPPPPVWAPSPDSKPGQKPTPAFPAPAYRSEQTPTEPAKPKVEAKKFDKSAKDTEEWVYELLKEGHLKLKEPDYDVFLHELKGRRLIRPIFFQRDSRGDNEYFATADEGVLKVDLAKKTLQITLYNVHVFAKDGIDRATMEERTFSVPLPGIIQAAHGLTD